MAPPAGPAVLPLLAGDLRIPAIGVIGNSASLVDLGGAEFFRIQAAAGAGPGLPQTPLAGAAIRLVDQSGNPLTNETGRTDADGRFTLSGPAGQSRGAAFAQATFAAEGKTFVFERVLTAGGAGTVSIDAASTLVVAKCRRLLAGGAVDPATLQDSAVSRLEAVTRSGLSLATVPFMASTSKDLVPAFDQLVQDEASVAEAARALALPVAVPGSWTVATVFSEQTMLDRGLLPPGRHLSEAGSFQVDRGGNLYVPGFAGDKGLPIYRVPPGGQPAEFASLPAGMANPVTLTVSADGVLHAMALTALTREIRVFRGSGPMEQVGGGGRAPVTTDGPGAAPVSPIQNPGTTGTPVLDPRPPALTPDREAIPGASHLVVGPDGQILFASSGGQTLEEAISGPADPGGDGSKPGAEGSTGGTEPSGEPVTGETGATAGPAVGPGEATVESGVPLRIAAAPTARFSAISGVAFVRDALLVADGGAGIVARVRPGSAVERLAGVAGKRDYRNGRGGYAQFGALGGVAGDEGGQVFVVDSGFRRIRRLSSQGSVFVVAGTGAPGTTDGAGHQATFRSPSGLVRDGAGNLYVLDRTEEGAEVIRKISPP